MAVAAVDWALLLLLGAADSGLGESVTAPGRRGLIGADGDAGSGDTGRGLVKDSLHFSGDVGGTGGGAAEKGQPVKKPPVEKVSF